jgi:hypothetical protein
MNQETYYVVRYTGPFGYIKPWTAVRDSETFSQQFLTPSMLCGMERKLFPELLDTPFDIVRIAAYRLSYSGLSMQQEQTQPRGWNREANPKGWSRKRAILVRGVMLNPVLHLAFRSMVDAEVAASQHLCLCRNEDIVFPDPAIQAVSAESFDEPPFDGFELVFGESEQSFVVGYNRFDEGRLMQGRLKIVGNPVNTFMA